MTDEMFRPPVNHAMRVLDRSFFKKNVLISAAIVNDRRKIARCRNALTQDLLKLEKMQAVQDIPGSDGVVQKALLLKPGINPGKTETWSPILSQLVQEEDVSVVPYDLHIKYDFWDYQDIMDSIIPEEMHDEYPKGFSVVGHVAHLNLRPEFWPYKQLIADILLDKNPSLRSVINKIDDVGAESQFRTFNYELLRGDPDLNVEVSEEGCSFRFDYAKVYWNPRLNTEHRRLVESFKPGEAICDVMAGVGPFSVPAGRKRCWVMANDLNPDCYDSLQASIGRNKVRGLVTPYNEDGRTFIKDATHRLWIQPQTLDVTPSIPRASRGDSSIKPPTQKILTRPRTFAHYVLNLPASAITFLSSFVGLYSELGLSASSKSVLPLPLIHVYCFNAKTADNSEAEINICNEISEQIGHAMTIGDMQTEGAISIWDVRDVSPQKRMFCASFRLPAAVAFRRT